MSPASNKEHVEVSGANRLLHPIAKLFGIKCRSHLSYYVWHNLQCCLYMFHSEMHEDEGGQNWRLGDDHWRKKKL